ncbi:ribonuclease T2 family protein [Pararhizobium antarcticum]|uniref:ribonuclease T2 family protein n=1 Tax=Pararhizobium antarcticum TaxID=1798805 RepID=UPI001FD9AFE9|nr:ribonuclease T(2) [Pararhizobium antarcticum]
MRFFSAGLLLAAAAALAACDNGEQAKAPDQARPHQTKATTEQTQREQIQTHKPVPSSIPATNDVPLGTGFDYYVLSLSWSPTWCAGNDAAGRTEQCAADASNGFIVHGLWPQNEKGFPEYCQTREPDRVPERLGRSLFDMMPSMGLIGHQWRKHGSCSGLRQAAYFAVVRAARQKLKIPPALQTVDRPRQAETGAIEMAFIAANPGLRANAIAVTCEGQYLEEVRICYNKDLSFRPCPEVDARSCRRKSVTVPPAP